MAQFHLSVAGQTACVQSLFESTRDYCAEYLTQAPPDFSVEITPQDLAVEQAFLDEEARQEGLKCRKFSETFLERAVLQHRFAEHLLSHGALLFHGSAVALDGRGYVFTAKCGVGKSTHTRLWRQAFPDRAMMINDDKPFLQTSERGILVCGAPWTGKHGLGNNITVPLQGICILERGLENRICPLSAPEAAPFIGSQCCPPLQPDLRPAFDALVQQLLTDTVFWRMECTEEPEAAIVAHGAMSLQHSY